MEILIMSIVQETYNLYRKIISGYLKIKDNFPVIINEGVGYEIDNVRILFVPKGKVIKVNDSNTIYVKSFSNDLIDFNEGKVINSVGMLSLFNNYNILLDIIRFLALKFYDQKFLKEEDLNQYVYGIGFIIFLMRSRFVLSILNKLVTNKNQTINFLDECIQSHPFGDALKIFIKNLSQKGYENFISNIEQELVLCKIENIDLNSLIF